MYRFFFIQDTDSSASLENPIHPSISKSRVVVEEDQLMHLFRVCRLANCGSAIDPAEIIMDRTGAALTVKTTCNSNHVETWSSSPSIGEGHSKVHVINILLVRSSCMAYI